MSRTIRAIEPHMILPIRSKARRATASLSIGRRGEVGLQNRERKLVAEWQRGVEILGHAQQKLRIAFAPAHSTALATLDH